MNTITSPLISDLLTIYQQANTNTDDECCMVSPSPELSEQIKQELSRLKKRAPGVLSSMVRVKDREAPGLNDGLIYPGEMFTLGTPVRKIRNAALQRAPLHGIVRVIVVLVQFADKAMIQSKQHYQELFFSEGVLPKGSVQEYFKEVTSGLVNLQGEVVGPYTLPLKITQYANGASGTGSSLPNARQMAKDAAIAANPQVNFAPYDNDGDGFVDAFIVIHAGAGAEQTGSKADIWSHKWVLPGSAYSADGAKIYAYLTVPEDSKIGVCAHELGHLLFGFPDLYDTDYSSEGIGNWCLMAGGSWNGGGDIPAHPSAWCKVNQGWAQAVIVKENGTLNIEDIKSSQKAYRLWKNGAAGSEYFLVENRQKSGYDRLLPGEGVLIWHIDESIESNSDETHPKVALIQADNQRDLEQGNNRGDAGDVFPGSSNNVTFNPTSAPNSNSYAHADTNVSLTKISASGATMTAQVTVKPAKSKETKESKKERAKEKEKEKEFFKELFDWKVSWETRGMKPSEAPETEYAPAMDVEARISALEARLAALEPFIDSSLRPDLRLSALADEPDIDLIRSEIEDDILRAKRLYDTKPREY